MHPAEAPRWRMGVIGCGRMGRVHAERLRQTGRAEIVALCDADPAAAAGLQAALAPQAVVVPSAEELAARSDLDAVVVCSPTPLHEPQTAAALTAGKHVLCEKPLADSAAGLERLLRLAEQAGTCAVLAYQRRFWGTYRTLRREVQSGRWGAIRAVASHNTERWQQTISGTWRDDPLQNPGGFLGDAGSHKLDALCFVTDLTPREVFARSQKLGSRVEIVVSVSAVMSDPRHSADAVPVTMDFVGCAEHQAEDLTVHCEEADLMVRDWRVWIARRNEVLPLTPLEPTTDPATGFIELLDGGGPNPAPFAAARPVWRLTQMILESAATGRPVAAE